MVVNDGDLPWLKVTKIILYNPKENQSIKINQGTKNQIPFLQKHTTIIQTNPSIIIETPRIAPVLPGGAKRTNKAGKAGETKAEPHLFDGIPSMDPDSNGGEGGRGKNKFMLSKQKIVEKNVMCFFWGGVGGYSHYKMILDNADDFGQ